MHRMTAQELAEEVNPTVDFDESIVDIRSPLKLENEKRNVFQDIEEESHGTGLVDDDLKEEHQLPQSVAHPSIPNGESMAPPKLRLPQGMAEREDLTTEPTNLMLQDEAPVNPASFLFRSSRLGDDDESSEDELQSPVRTFSSQTPATSRGRNSRLSATNRAVLGQSPAFTPLAAQLSGWLASSPNKQPVKKYQQRGIFSPVAAQHVPGEVIIDRQSPATSRVSIEPRYSATHRQALGSRKSTGPRYSLAGSMNQSPDRSTYFADEMAVRDLEEEIEYMQAAAQDHDGEPAANSVEHIHAKEFLPDGIVAEGIDSLQAEEIFEQNQAEERNVEENLPGKVDQDSCEFPINPEAGAVGETSEGKHRLPGTSHEFTVSSAYADEKEVPTPAAAFERVLANFQQSTAATPVLVSSVERHPLTEFVTPSRPQPAMSRFANTIVSKVPLLAEGNVSPIKNSKKRSRSLSMGPSSVRKTPVLHNSSFPRSTTVYTFSPAQSQPDTPCSIVTTPGQQSFAVDDFGDSTLDGIEIDEDDENLPPFTPTVTGVPRLVVTPGTSSTQRCASRRSRLR